jgi:rhamnogalacturonan endolyase
MGAWWDGDLLRELLDGVRVSKWDWERGVETPLLDGWDSGCVANNGSKSNPCLCADIVGDWREEIVAARLDGRELRVFVSTIPTEYRLVTLMHDPVYRLGVAWQNVAYNQPAHTSFYLGEGMALPGGGSPRSRPARASPIDDHLSCEGGRARNPRNLFIDDHLARHR